MTQASRPSIEEVRISGHCYWVKDAGAAEDTGRYFVFTEDPHTPQRRNHRYYAFRLIAFSCLPLSTGVVIGGWALALGGASDSLLLATFCIAIGLFGIGVVANSLRGRTGLMTPSRGELIHARSSAEAATAFHRNHFDR